MMEKDEDSTKSDYGHKKQKPKYRHKTQIN